MFRGVYYEILGYDYVGNEWFVYFMKKVMVGEEIGLYFEFEVIYVMWFNEMEEEFDKWFEGYEEDYDVN